MLNSPMLSIFQHFHAILLRSPLISLRSKWRLTGFSRRFTPKNPVRLHKPFGQLPRWGAKNVLPLNLIALPVGGATFDCLRKRFSRFYRFNGFNGGGAAHKIRKRRPIISHFQFLISISRPAHTFPLLSRLRLHYWKVSRGRPLHSRSSMHSPRQIPKASWTASTHHYCHSRRS